MKTYITYSNPPLGIYERMIEIAGQEIKIIGTAGRDKGIMILGLNFLEDHKPWMRRDDGIEFNLNGHTIRIK